MILDKHLLSVIFIVFTASLFAQDYIIEKLPSGVNSDYYNEIAPIISIDGRTLYFTRTGSMDFNKTLYESEVDISEKLTNDAYIAYLCDAYSQIAGEQVTRPFTSDLNQDIWIAICEDGNFDRIIHPEAPLNNALPNSICSLTPDPDAFVVINQFPKAGGMQKGFSIVQRSDEGWDFPKPIYIENYYTRKTGLSMTMSNDGDVLILSLDREDTFGDNDLYICHKISENQWSVPENLGNQINSKYREATPHLSPDTKRLYYCSNRKGTLGGMDIFYVDRLDDTWRKWSSPRQFLEPINSDKDDSQPYFNPASGYLYFSSKRDGTSDIFRVKIAPNRTQEVQIVGRIINTATNEPTQAKITWTTSTQKDKIQSYETDIDGSFSIKVKQGDDLIIVPSKDKFIGQEKIINVDKNIFYTKPLEVNLLLDPMAKGTYISINPIYFERTKSSILEKSFPEMDRLVKLMNDYKEINILIEGHTDNNGEQAGLQKLSEERALSVKDYLIKNNIATNRIETQGYGGRAPIAPNDSENNRSLNRRVEIKITKVTQ